VSIPRFFQRVHAAVGRHLLIDRNTLAKRLESVCVGIECPPPTDRGGTWTCELLVNQLARLYPSICLFGSAANVADMRELASSINPKVALAEDPSAATVSVSTSVGSGAGYPTATARGWTARFSARSSGSVDPDPNPFACGAAAAFAAGALFRRILLVDDGATSEETSVDILSFSSEARCGPSLLEEKALDLGRVGIAGVGAVGNAALWALGRCPQLTGLAYVVEPETVELSNMQRYVLALDADEGVEKTVLAQRALGKTGLTLELKRARLEELQLPRELDTILVTIDNKEGRRVAQSLLPRLIVNGWTSDSGLGVSWHDFAPDTACLACLYQPTGPSPSQTEIVAEALGLDAVRAALLWVTPERVGRGDVEVIARKLGANVSELRGWVGKPLQALYSNLVCGSAALGIGLRGRIEVVPLAHQSVLAGVLAGAELVKRSDPRLRAASPLQNLIAWHDVTRPPPSLWLQHRASELGCICRDDDYRAVYDNKWGATRNPS
jgi:hypothetical protein